MLAAEIRFSPYKLFVCSFDHVYSRIVPHRDGKTHKKHCYITAANIYIQYIELVAAVTFSRLTRVAVVEMNVLIIALVTAAIVALLVLLCFVTLRYYHHWNQGNDENDAMDDDADDASSRRRQRNRNHRTSPTSTSTKENEVIYVRLNEFEDKLLLSGGRLVTTITWFRGDHTVAATALQDRLDAIVCANVWLTGQIQWRYGRNYLVYRQKKKKKDDSTSQSQRASEGLFFHLTPSESPLSRDTPPDAISEIVRQHALICKPRYHQDLYRVCVVPCNTSPQTHFALIVSMSHIAGDSQTFYALYNSLLSFHDNHNEPKDSTIPKLIVNRVSGIRQDLRHAMQSRRDPMLSVSWSLMIPSALALLYGKVRGIWNDQYRIHQRYVMIDVDKIELMKQEAIQAYRNRQRDSISVNANEQPLSSPSDHADAPTLFCSLNDVVSSWLMMNSQCQHGFMAVNLRNRSLSSSSSSLLSVQAHQQRGLAIESKCKGELYTDELAGNYITLLYYQIPRHCTCPLSIRQSLSHLRRVESSPSLATMSSSLVWKKMVRTNQNRLKRTPTATTTTVTPTTSAEDQISSTIISNATKNSTAVTPIFLWGGAIVMTNWCSFRRAHMQPVIQQRKDQNSNNKAESQKSCCIPLPSTILPDDNTTSEFTSSDTSIHIDGMHEEIHFPLYTYQMDTHPYNTIMAILFRSNTTSTSHLTTNSIGMLLCGRPAQLDTMISRCPFLGTSSLA
jgi:hypothetical protein